MARIDGFKFFSCKNIVNEFDSTYFKHRIVTERERDGGRRKVSEWDERTEKRQNGFNLIGWRHTSCVHTLTFNAIRRILVLLERETQAWNEPKRATAI